MGLGHGGQKILVVDDDTSIRTVLCELLRFAGHDVIECSDSNEALAIIDRCAGSLGMLIADYALPGLNGVALAREAKRIAPWIGTLITSGHCNVRKECRNVGVGFLAKPFGTADVLAALRKLDMLAPKRPQSVRRAELCFAMAT